MARADRLDRKVLLRLEKALSPTLEPGEKIESWTYGLVHRRRMWLLKLIPDVIAMPVELVLEPPYIVAATDRRLFAIHCSRVRISPRKVQWDEPLSRVSIEEHEQGRLNTKLALRRDPDGKVLRLKVQRPQARGANAIAERVRSNRAPERPGQAPTA